MSACRSIRSHLRDTEKFADAFVADARRHVHSAVLGIVISAAIASATMWGPGSELGVFAWCGAVTFIGACRVLLFHPSVPGLSRLSSVAKCRGLVLLALANGVVWGIGGAAAVAVATPGQFLMVSLMLCGMMGASAMSYGAIAAPVPAFVIPSALGLMVAWAVYPGAPAFNGMIVTAIQNLVLIRGAFSNQRSFIQKFLAEESARESAETVQLLMNDFAEQASDWLWEVDSKLRIADPSERFVSVSGRSSEELSRTLFLELFDDTKERRNLAAAMASADAVRDLTLSLTIKGEKRWWTLSGRPCGASGGFRGVASDVTAQKAAEARISHMAHYDALTDLANRFLFNESLDHALGRLSEGQRIGVLYLDLDHFKSVNDTLGHGVGDQLLREVATRLTQTVASRGLTARLGGDEFAILVQGRNVEATAAALAQEIVEDLRRPYQIEGARIETRTSIGIAFAEPRKLHAADLMKHADLALYRAKELGRDRFVVFQQAMIDRAYARRELEMDLRAALCEGDLRLHFQPLVDMRSSKVLGYEALVRWEHAERGLIMPETFIPLAEETGLIVELGEWVIREAAATARLLPEGQTIAVNLSPAQLRSSHLLSTVISAVAHAGIEPGRLELEITESVFMQDSEANMRILRQLRDFGLRISLDDFGTGYSSLSYLRRFPFDKIKIDRSFVAEMRQSDDCLKIVRAITDLAHDLGIATTAEGVEDEAQLAMLQSVGCELGQGFLFGRPEPYQVRMAVNAPVAIGKLPV